jgi:hypothetical protein
MTNIYNLADHPRANADVDVESRARRAEAVRAKIEADDTTSAADRPRIAENLFRLLARLEKDKGVKRARLCQAVFNRPEEESTKRLRLYALDPGKEGEKREKQISELTTSITNYVALAEAAARSAGEDVDDALLHLVHGTSFAKAGTLRPEDPMTRDLKAPLIHHLERATAKVASEADLQRTFQLISRYPVAKDDVDGTVIAGPINEPLLCLDDGSTSPPPDASGRDWRRLVRSAPAVLIGEAILDRVAGEPQLEGTAFNFQLEEYSLNPLVRRKFSRRKIKRPAGERWSAVTEYRVRVWLALLPFGPSHEPRLGLCLELLRHVKIEHMRAPSEPPTSLPEDVSPEQRARYEMQQKIHETLKRSDDRRVPREILSTRILDLRRDAWWRSPEEDLRVTVPVDFAPFAPWLGLLLGRQLYQDEATPARILAFSSEEAQRVLDLPDCGGISDWVGPLPDQLYSGFQLWPEPKTDDPFSADQWGKWQDWECARREGLQRDEAYRFRFASLQSQEPAPQERYPMSWRAGTLGYKLERSLLEIDDDNGVIQQLRAQAEHLVAEVQNKVGAALSARDERLTKLHSS